MFEDCEVKFHKIGDREILEVFDEIDGETSYYEVVAEVNPYAFSPLEFLRETVAIMMAVGAKVEGFDDPDDLYEVDLDELDEELVNKFHWLYEDAEATLPKEYLIEYDNFDNWLLLKVLDELPTED